MRQIVLDTETTGIGHEIGHRIIEIGCLEMVDRKLTGKHFHVYINPMRAVDEGAFKVHGISTEFLQTKPLFEDIVQEFMTFVSGAELIIHNAPFDVGFLNAELKRIFPNKTIQDHCTVLDTLVMAKQKHPGQRNSLDALCKRYDVDNSSRQWHGALLDAELLAFVYLAMTGGQTHLLFDEEPIIAASQSVVHEETYVLNPEDLPVLRATQDELARHYAFIEFLKQKSGVDYW